MIQLALRSSNAAIFYLPHGYSTDGKNIMGIHSASEGFLQGFLRHADIDTAYCAVDDDAGAFAFQEAVARTHRNLAVKAFPIRRPETLTEVGCLYLPGPGLNEFAWRRRQFDQRGHSLCGITHTTATATVMDAIADFAVAPVQSWDALICTSHAVQRMVGGLLDDQAKYLRERLGATDFSLPQMPVIPLGVDTEAFAHSDADRKEWRARLSISDDDIAILFVGRLSFHAKAHPIPMYRALAKAADRTTRRLHLILAGWFSSETHETHFRNAAAEICPAVNLLVVDGIDPKVRTTIWSAADIFTSLADNIQETFGLTPIEAMAAGLPVVVSDWDGYRDTVRDGIDGYRVPTVMAPTLLGGDLAYQYATSSIDYDAYIGRTAQFVAVDIDACATAYAMLIDNDALRRRMGDEGRNRARTRFDWQTVVAAYQALWGELGTIRRSSSESVALSPQGSARPARPDPFHSFSGYPSACLTPGDVVSRTAESAASLEMIRNSPLVSFSRDALPTWEESLRILELIEGSAHKASDVADYFPLERRGVIFRSLVWLAKYGVISITAAAPQSMANKP